MAHYEEAPDLIELAARLIDRRPEEVGHVEISTLVILREFETSPGNGTTLATCFAFKDDHPIRHYCGEKRFGIVLYMMNMEYMTPKQIAILLLHELQHIHPEGKLRCVDHNVQDFRNILGIDLDWSGVNREVPDIAGLDEEAE